MQIHDGSVIEYDIFVGLNATFTKDRYPRSKLYTERFTSTTLRKGASISANATSLPGIVFGRNALVGAGAVVTKNVSDNAVVACNQAKIVRYI